MNESRHLDVDITTMMENERKRDRLIRRVSGTAWIVTLSIMFVFAGIVGVEVLHTLERVGLGVATNGDVVGALVPLLAVVGTTSLLLALVSTAAVFLRFRTASLADLQLRLVSLEAALAEEG